MQNSEGKSHFDTCVEVAEKYNLSEIMQTTLNSLKSYNRLFEKTMMFSRNIKEIHKTSRGIHTQQASAEAAEMAKCNKLNVGFLKISMNAHDIAHSFFGHQGGRVISSISCLNNGTYFEHNSMGPYMLEKENYREKVLYKVKKQNPEITTEELKKCEEYIFYFYDVILSHDGESKELITVPEKTEDIKQTVMNKIQNAYSCDMHKTVATTLEGALGKMIDVIAYLKTDFLDAFRNGSVDIYNEDYVVFLGKMFGEIDIKKGSKKEFLQIGLDYIQRKKDEQNQQNVEEFEKNIDEQTKKHIRTLISALNLPNEEQYFSKIIVKYLNEYMKLNKNDPQIYNKADIIKEYVNKNKKTKIETEVIESIFTDVQLKFKEAISIGEDDKGNRRIEMKEKEFELYDELRKLDYTYIIPFTRRNYQVRVLPEAVWEATNMMARNLMKTGIIKRFFEDPTIQGEISDSEMLKHMVVQQRNYKEEEKYQRKIGVGVEEKSKLSQKIEKIFCPERKHFKKIYEDVLRNKKMFSKVYINSFLAIENRVRAKVEDAVLDRNGEISYLEDEYLQQISVIKNEIRNKYKTLDITEEQKAEYIKMKVESERNNLEEIVSKNLAIEYIAGMTDMSVQNFCIDLKTTTRLDFMLNAGFSKQDDNVIKLKHQIYGETNQKEKNMKSKKQKAKKREYETKKEFKERMKVNSAKIENPNDQANIYINYLDGEKVNGDR